MKPQKEIFQLASKKMGIMPSKILFVDDDLRWVRASKDFGFKSVRFISPKQIKNKFKMLNIL